MGVLIQETIDRFGYDPRELLKRSSKKVLVKCDYIGCHKINERRYWTLNKHPEYYHCRSCSRRNIPLSEETKRKISEACKGRYGPSTGKSMSEETKRKISKAASNRIRLPHSEETKCKIRNAHLSCSIEIIKSIKKDLQNPFYRHKDLAKKYKISQYIIDGISNGKTYKWIKI